MELNLYQDKIKKLYRREGGNHQLHQLLNTITQSESQKELCSTLKIVKIEAQVLGYIIFVSSQKRKKINVFSGIYVKNFIINLREFF